MTTIGTVAEDGPGAAVTNDTGHEVPPMIAVLGGLRVRETLGRTTDTEGAEVMKMTSIEVPRVTTRGLTMNQAHVAALRHTPLHHPDPGPKAKRASPGLTAQLRTSTQPPAPRNSLWEGLHLAPTLGPCPGHALAPGPGLDVSLEATDCFYKSQLISLQLSVLITRVSCLMFAFIYHYQ